MEAQIIEKIKPGTKIRVWERIKEGDKERQSAFEGIVLARKHGTEPGATFTVRAILQEIGVEKVFPINSPNIAKVEIVSEPKKIRRSKLYFLRTLSSKKVREKLKHTA
ncbi:MAG: 50S ribosomal protein L19 [Patescibacteria group bacterium]